VLGGAPNRFIAARLRDASAHTIAAMEFKQFDLHGKVAIVTGGNGGIGLGIARGLASSRAQTWRLPGRNADKTAKAVKELEGLGVRSVGLERRRGRRRPGGSRWRPRTRSPRWVEFDILIANAGTNFRKRPEEYSLSEWHRIVDTNLNHVFTCAQAVHPEFKRRGGGKIVTIGSMASIFGFDVARFMRRPRWSCSRRRCSAPECCLWPRRARLRVSWTTPPLVRRINRGNVEAEDAGHRADGHDLAATAALELGCTAWAQVKTLVRFVSTMRCHFGQRILLGRACGNSCPAFAIKMSTPPNAETVSWDHLLHLAVVDHVDVQPTLRTPSPSSSLTALAVLSALRPATATSAPD